MNDLLEDANVYGQCPLPGFEVGDLEFVPHEMTRGARMMERLFRENADAMVSHTDEITDQWEGRAITMADIERLSELWKCHDLARKASLSFRDGSRLSIVQDLVVMPDRPTQRSRRLYEVAAFGSGLDYGPQVYAEGALALLVERCLDRIADGIVANDPDARPA